MFRINDIITYKKNLNIELMGELFNHKWFFNDTLVQQENNLMEISMNGSLPMLIIII